jgi:hypothetical protein
MLRLRYRGRCRECDAELSAGAMARYDRASRTVICLACAPEIGSASDESVAPARILGATQASPSQAVRVPTPEPFAGVAGASANREYELRRARRESRIRNHHPIVGGLVLALTDDPQSTKAWAVGAAGEERLGRRLDRRAGNNLRILHDRRIPRSRANIDHIAIGPSGVFVIDAKKHKGGPALRVEGGFFRPRTEKLIVGTRDGTKLVAGVQNQVTQVEDALDSAGFGDVPVRGMLCFVEADWPLFGGDFVVKGVYVLWPAKATSHVSRPGNLTPDGVGRIYRALAHAFPVA